MKLKLLTICLFISGGGTKLIQSQIGNSDQIMTLPSYPLLYFYSHWKDWIKKYRNMSINKIYNLLIKHHASVVNSKNIRGFNGLTNLGRKKDKYISVPKTKFKKFFFEFLKNKKINSRNTLLAIHYAFHKARGKDFSKIKYILFHVHNFETFNKYFIKDFPDALSILATRNHLENFWRKAFSEKEIERNRYDYTDQEYLKNFSYLNLNKSIFLDVNNINTKSINKKNTKIVKFEDLKLKNENIIKKLCMFLKIKFKKKYLIPKFLGLEWWSHKNYKSYSSKKIFEAKLNLDPEDKEKFFSHEVYVLEKILYPFYKKFNYKFTYKNYNFLFFIFFLILPTKYGLKLFFSRFLPEKIFNYIKNSYDECFNFKMKDYYFNAMYKYKYTYRDIYLLKFNFLRKITFILRKSQIRYLFSIILFILKILLYFYIQFELIFLYFYRIHIFIYYFLKIKFFKKEIIKSFRM